MGAQQPTDISTTTHQLIFQLRECYYIALLKGNELRGGIWQPSLEATPERREFSAPTCPAFQKTSTLTNLAMFLILLIYGQLHILIASLKNSFLVGLEVILSFTIYITMHQTTYNFSRIKFLNLYYLTSPSE
jgi:hypothetical protein